MGRRAFEDILRQFHQCVENHHYVTTVHADEEMDADHLSVFDVERGILTGEILERQKDALTGEWKYRIQGCTLFDAAIEMVIKLGANGKAVVITVYLA